MTFLQRILLADGVVSGAAGLVMILGGAWLSPILNLPGQLLLIAGFILLPWMAALIALARAETPSRAAVRAVIAINLAWVAASVAVLFVTAPSVFGYAFVIAQAVVVGVFAELQIIALKRAAAAPA